MVAMSIWGNPAIGKLTRTLNSTQVALGRYASFVSSIPFAGDELQTIKNRWDSFDNLVMYLTEGIDRSRGQQFGGIEQLRSWNCNFIFTGEEPITKQNSGGGVKNRCIEIETTEKLINDGNAISNLVRENYGFAGKQFIKNLPSLEQLQIEYKTIFQELLTKMDTTDKQAMAIASILLADSISSNMIFQDDCLQIEDVREWIASSKDVDIAVRAYDWTVSWISQNSNKFKPDSLTEVWGKIAQDNDGKRYAYIIKKVYVSELARSDFDFDAIKKKLAENGNLIKGNERYDKACRIGENVVKCIQILLPSEEEKETEFLQTELPF